MKISIDMRFYTDGDYCIDSFEQYNLLKTDDYTYDGCKVFKGKRSCNEAVSYLDSLLTAIRIGSRHVYLIKTFYEEFETLRNFILKREPGEETIYLSGNYDGTRISVIILDYPIDEFEERYPKWDEFVTEMRSRINDFNGERNDDNIRAYLSWDKLNKARTVIIEDRMAYINAYKLKKLFNNGKLYDGGDIIKIVDDMKNGCRVNTIRCYKKEERDED